LFQESTQTVRGTFVVDASRGTGDNHPVFTPSVPAYPVQGMCHLANPKFIFPVGRQTSAISSKTRWYDVAPSAA
jgi:hypothetical protein